MVEKISSDDFHINPNIVQLYDLVPSLIVLTDNKGLIAYVNKRFTDVTGYSLEEVRGKNPRVLKGGETKPETYKDLWDTITSKQSWFGEFHNRKKNGDKYWASVSIIPILDQNGNIIMFCGIQEDITSNKLKELNLRASEQKFSALYNSSMDAIMILDPLKGFISGNPSTIKLFACKDEKEFSSYTPGQLSPKLQPDGRPSDEKAKEMIGFAMKDGSYSFEWTHKKTTGETFPCLVLLTRFELQDKVLIQATVRDITQQKKQELELLNSLEEAKLFSKTFIDRELAMINLKKEVNHLLLDSGREQKYKV